MRKLILGVVLNVAVVSTGLAQTAPSQLTMPREQIDNMVGDFMFCVRRTAARLEPSGDAPKDVAEAAVFLCLPQETAVVNVLLKNSTYGVSPSALRQTGIFYGSGQVVASRLCRKTKDCALAPPPP